ncbi:ATP-binding protein [Effusibacillus dendaii]|uniref:ATP-binding protein n=1 Tax=Effusibacillus dendaii TaxID=2743772 RepID=UPI00384D36B6
MSGYLSFAKPQAEHVEEVDFTQQVEEIATVEIKDQGIGMTPQEIERLGTPCYSMKRSGTGLGLMVSYRIIESFHGKIKVVSKKGKGTQFFIRLPVEKGPVLA